MFIGNSLTEFYDTPNMFREMANAARKSIYVDDRAVSGMLLEEHSVNKETIDKIKEQDWDYVILQGSNYNIEFPRNHGFITGPIMTLKRIILNNNSKTKIIFLFRLGNERGCYLW